MECREIDWMNAPEDPELTFKMGLGRCEVCGRELDVSEPRKIYLSLKYRDSTTLITCSRCEEPGTYEIELGRFLQEPIEWMAQLYGKNWFKPEKFCKAMYRLRDARQEIDQAERGRERAWMKES